MSKIYFRFGTMNCGKTTALLQVAHNYEEKNLNICVIKVTLDKNTDNFITSHLGINRQADIVVQKNEKITAKINFENLKCILVDEAQFMSKEQIKELWIISKLYDVPVICYGFKTNFKGELFNGSKALIEISDEIEELVTICSCGKKAKFTARIQDGKYMNVEHIIASEIIDDEQEALCGKCYIEKVLKIKKDTIK